MAIGDSRLLRESNSLVQTLLGIARLRQSQQEADRAESTAQRKAAQEDEDRKRELASRSGIVKGFREAIPPTFSEAAPDDTGGAPLMDPGYGATSDQVNPKLDMPSLIEHLMNSKAGRETVGAPQMQPFLQQSGIVQSPEAIKLGAQRSELDAGRPNREAALRAMGRTPEEATALGGISTEDFGRISQAGTREQQADTAQQRAEIYKLLYDLARQKEFAETPMGEARRDNLRSQADWRSGKTPWAQVKMGVDQENLSALRAKAPFVGPTAEANLESIQAGTGQKKALTGLTGARQTNVEQRTKDLKTGKVPATKRHPLVDLYKRQIQALQEKPGKAGYFGSSVGSTPADSVADQVEMMKLRAPGDKAREYIDQAYLETLSGRTQGANGAGGEQTATGPNGQKLILRDGQWVPYVP